ncbi:hypothetical protein GCM10027416_03620 [Okibacterium endophyticum]
MSSTPTRRTYSFLACAAGGALGLLTGALAYSALIPGPDFLSLAARTILFGVAPLLIGLLAIGLPLIFRFNRHNTNTPTAILITVGSSIALAVVAGIVTELFGISPFYNGFLLFGLPTIWCMTAAALLLKPLTSHPALSWLILGSTALFCIVGAFTLIL